jgi:hypothetical protein
VISDKRAQYIDVRELFTEEREKQHWVASSGVAFVPGFVKIGQVFQKSKLGT